MDKHKEALQLAGKLALAVQLVIDANVFNLSSRMLNLEQALNEYNIKIIKISNDSKN